MSSTDGLIIPFIGSGSEGGVLHNEALAVIDAVCGKGVEGIRDDAPSAPNELEAWVIGTPTLGDAWDGHDGEIAIYLNGAWRFYAVAQGVRTIDRSNNLALQRGSAGWHHSVGIACWFGRLSTAYTYTGTAADSINNWTQMVEQPGSDALFDHNPTASDDGRLELQEGGVYRCQFSGVVVPSVAADTYRVGFGVNSATPATGMFADLAVVAAGLTVPRSFCVESIRSFSAGDDLFVACDKQTAGSGQLQFVDESCKWSIMKLSP